MLKRNRTHRVLLAGPHEQVRGSPESWHCRRPPPYSHVWAVLCLPPPPKRTHMHVQQNKVGQSSSRRVAAIWLPPGVPSPLTASVQARNQICQIFTTRSSNGTSSSTGRCGNSIPAAPAPEPAAAGGEGGASLGALPAEELWCGRLCEAVAAGSGTPVLCASLLSGSRKWLGCFVGSSLCRQVGAITGSKQPVFGQM